MSLLLCYLFFSAKGLVGGIVCYHHYYPSVFDVNCHCSHASVVTIAPDCEMGLPHNTSRMNIRQE